MYNKIWSIGYEFQTFLIQYEYYEFACHKI